MPLALLFSGQALAQDRDAPRGMSAEQVGDALSNPMVQSGIAGLVAAFTDNILDTRIGPIARYSDDVRPEDTLGGLVRREDPRFDENLQRRTRGAVALAGQATRDGVAMSNELGKTADRLQLLIEGTAALVRAYSGNDRPARR
ncbi:MAG: hypothetical protein V4808_04120 [Pseudomonadota bacterium]